MNYKYDYVGSIKRKTYWYASITPQQIGFSLNEIAYYLRGAILHFLFVVPAHMVANNYSPQPDGGDTGNSGEQSQ